MTIPGTPPPKLPELVRADDRLTFIYLERCLVHRDSNAITAQDDRGTVHIPAASLNVLLLGPGTRVTHQAVSLLAESGATAVWVGEQGVRYYAHGRSLARSTRLLEAQASKVTNRNARLAVAREMYAMRFPGEDTSGLTMQQLRGREGARVRRLYREHAERTGVQWQKRDYDPEDFTAGDLVNQALSAANTSLYGVVHAVIVALGCSPGLGFIHTGHERSFVYDVADLYKAETTIPTAFDVAARNPADVAAETRRTMRDAMHDRAFLDRCVGDIRRLLLPEPKAAPDDEQADPAPTDSYWDEDLVKIWDEKDDPLAGGVNYSDDVDF
ncbi:type I-E CRISPR-associated endonuclease Cas1 [Natronosporangium hydrolyticum]|uniref:CRISPR-associated endonuclease Cas1 n=1 Tax=Natronosporangium hydrolyticum TaxID=2811111 RepID=A0A895YPW8_9ACTN|nr:type I-E CRISPR-associated endonuclease Cas1 [Natronosporangium hydrolyticum]